MQGNTENYHANSPSSGQKKRGKIRKVSLAVLLGSLLFTGTGFARESLHDQYLIYEGDEYIGTVKSREVIDHAVDEKKERAEAAYGDLELVVGRDLSVVKEKVFGNPESADEESVKKTLDKTLDVEAKSIAVQVDGSTLFHLKDTEAFDHVIRGVKLTHMTKEELENYEDSREAGEFPEPEAGQTQVTHLSLKADLQAKEVYTDPENIRTEKEALKLLRSERPVERDYTAAEGDKPEEIAESHGMSMKQLLELNRGIDAQDPLAAGDTVKILVEEPYVEVSITRKQREASPIAHTKVVKDDEALLKGEKKIARAGKDGRKETLSVTETVNGKTVSEKVLEDEVTEKPVDELILNGTKAVAGKALGKFAWPAQGGYVSSQKGPRWGRQHNGIDIARPSGKAILAADAGTVTATGPQGGYGNRVVVDHGNGYTTLYAHLESISVKPGQKLAQGQKLGVMGNTGNSTGVHLHFEVRKNGQLINPLTVVSQ
ncbi:LysM peptidoglycan-binding domain-containing protein [Bhargavaea beijingensis]|uniref:LysM peptidoglycan-binding domain-containing protein n=1 Tax=Bhargavaea beijingensis TaxID=426756 RepID=A0A1G7EUR6_9BACL|nr:LysM peptidoglycan-binding domain-containing protein [Bhargavaea beijingensis]SDE67440.1 Murein DD-endopeptidase MepM and murein hydrolase activator NlpD, contain LysM domain [Bhargavaea beijingensis]